MLNQFVFLGILSVAFGYDFLCDENFPVVTDFNIGDCEDGKVYNPNYDNSCLPGCEEVQELCSDVTPCSPGYYCNTNTRFDMCVIDEDSCLKYYTPVYKDARWRPNCDENGLWEPKQCKGDRCFCYGATGNRVFGTAFASQASNMTCACSRKRAELEATGDYYFVTLHCDDMGNFEPLQCAQGQCWCVEPKTGDMLTPTVPEKMMSRLSCYDASTVGSQYLRACESQVYAQERIRDEFRAHGTSRTYFSHLTCLYDGSFGPTKIDNGIVSCVWRDNTAIGYSADLNGAVVDDINCNCARDVKIYQMVGLQLLRTCLANGNYDPVQKDGDEYYCVDSDGFRISDMRPSVTAEECSNIRQ